MESISTESFQRRGLRQASCWASTPKACSFLKSLMEIVPPFLSSPGGKPRRSPLQYAFFLIITNNCTTCFLCVFPQMVRTLNCFLLPFKKKKICLQNTSDEIKHLFQTDSSRTCQYLLQMCTDQHKFSLQTKARQTNQELQDLGTLEDRSSLCPSGQCSENGASE